jgi:hypothetical protein
MGKQARLTVLLRKGTPTGSFLNRLLSQLGGDSVGKVTMCGLGEKASHP